MKKPWIKYYFLRFFPILGKGENPLPGNEA